VDVERAADLYAQGWTLRQIGAELDVPCPDRCVSCGRSRQNRPDAYLVQGSQRTVMDRVSRP
jgi:hypothetical protein